MDSSLQTVLIPAIVALVVALLTPWVKNRFDKQARAEEWARKREDWLLEKQARDAEEIVTALERVLKGLTYAYDTASHELGNVAIYAKDSRGVVGDFTQEKFQRLNSEIDQIMRKHAAWFEYDIRRLSIWFADDKKVYKELQDMGERVNSMYHGLWVQLFTVGERWDERNTWPNPGDFQRAVEGDVEGFRWYRDRFPVLFDDIVRFQRELIKGLGGPQDEQVVTVDGDNSVAETSSDSLTVEVVRWLEQRVRRFR